MRKLIFVVGTALALAFGAGVAPASAHQAGPCNESGEPGNSDYAQHHITPLAQSGGMGDGGHKPGSHMGYSACLGVHD